MHFELKALKDTGTLVALSLDASDEAEALRQAKNQGYTVISVRQRQSLWERVSTPRGDRFPLVLFSQELLALLDAGLALVEALETLAEKETKPEPRRVLTGVISYLFEGQSLSYALSQYPKNFPPLYIATVRASEKTGDLPQALGRYVEYQERMDVVRKKIVSASIYPVLLLAVGGLVTLFLMGYVVPRFSHVYEDMGTSIPAFSQWLLQWGQFIQAHGLAVLAVLVPAIGALGYAFTRPSFRSWIWSKLWQVPAIGERMRIYQLARFYRTLGMLQQGGTPIVNALGMASDLLQSGLRGRLTEASTAIREGQSLSSSMERHGLTTPVALRMLAVGERTGRMGEMMDRIASFYDDEMARWVDWFTKLFEPILMAFIGLIIGTIVVLMYFPIFELAGSIQ
jgi:general secretion pathway protein F